MWEFIAYNKMVEVPLSKELPGKFDFKKNIVDENYTSYSISLKKILKTKNNWRPTPKSGKSVYSKGYRCPKY